MFYQCQPWLKPANDLSPHLATKACVVASVHNVEHCSRHEGEHCSAHSLAVHAEAHGEQRAAMASNAPPHQAASGLQHATDMQQSNRPLKRSRQWEAEASDPMQPCSTAEPCSSHLRNHAVMGPLHMSFHYSAAEQQGRPHMGLFHGPVAHDAMHMSFTTTNQCKDPMQGTLMVSLHTHEGLNL